MQYVDYAKGDSSGYIRFDQSDDAQKLIAAAAETEGSLAIAKHSVTFEALEGIPSALAFSLLESHHLIICLNFLLLSALNVMTFPIPVGEAEESYWKKLREGQAQRFSGGDGRGGQNRRGRGRFFSYPNSFLEI